MTNSVGRIIPKEIKGYGKTTPFAGAYNNISIVKRKSVSTVVETSHGNKIRDDLMDTLKEIDIRDGMTVSFHHHLRNGDKVLNLVMKHLSEMGVKDLTVAASSLFPVHAPLVKMMKSGVVTKIVANYISGPVADAISAGCLKNPAIMHTHGGRARAIESGDIQIDVAFIASPASDYFGNVNGVEGPAACGSLGYAIADAQYAQTVVVVTDTIVQYPAKSVEISQEYVDYVTVVDSVGDPAGIVSGTTQITRDPIGLKIASQTSKVIEAAGFLKDGFSFQTGAGGTSLAVADFLKQKMLRANIVGSFASGGITGYLVDMYEQGLFKALLDVQCFDLEAIRSFTENPNHQSMSASKYGNPHNKGAVVDQLDVMILGATEIDMDFNVNVTTGSDGRIMGGSGGHSDTAAGSQLAIVVTQLVKGRIPIVTDRVTTVTTPGETIDVLVTERGIAVNPKHAELKEKLINYGLNIVDIEELKRIAYEMTGEPEMLEFDEQIVAVVEYRDGTVIDVIRKV